MSNFLSVHGGAEGVILSGALELFDGFVAGERAGLFRALDGQEG